MGYRQVMSKLKSLANPGSVAGMSRFGINPKNNYGVSIPVLRKMSKDIGKDHELAQKLWTSGINDARILACYIDEPSKVTETQMEAWVSDFNSWDVCDQVCSNLFDKTNLAYEKAFEWSKRKEEFVKRAGFVMMAVLAVHDKKAEDTKLLKFLPMIKRESVDERNFVKKAVNWALREIGKRNTRLNKAAIAAARSIKKMKYSSSRWIASDALRELSSDAVQKRLRR